MGNRAGVRRAEDAPEPVAGDEVGGPAQPDAGGGAAGTVCVVVGALRGALGDGPGGGHGGAGPGSAVVRGLPADPALPLAGVPRAGVGVVRGVVRGAAGG